MGKDNQLKDRTGEVSYTKYGTKATTVQYINNKDVLVEFNDDYRFQYHTTYINFKNVLSELEIMIQNIYHIQLGSI